MNNFFLKRQKENKICNCKNKSCKKVFYNFELKNNFILVYIKKAMAT